MHGNGNGRPLGLRKRMQVVIAVVLLAWATQTLLHQWGFGAEIPLQPEEHFMPGSDRFVSGATLEILATDPGSVADFQAFCRTTGEELAEHSVSGGVYRFLIRRRAD